MKVNQNKGFYQIKAMFNNQTFSSLFT